MSFVPPVDKHAIATFGRAQQCLLGPPTALVANQRFPLYTHKLARQPT